MTSSERLHEHGIARTRRRFKSREDYDAACTFEWTCGVCGATEFTPKPQVYAEDDADEAPEHCGVPMDAVESQP